MVDDLLEATARVLAARGLDGTNTNEIARVAGVSVGSLYQYFSGKQGLAAALIERKAARDRAHIVAALRPSLDAPFAEVVRALVRATLEVHRRDAALMRALLSLVEPTGRAAKVREVASQGRAEVFALLAAHLPSLRETDLDLASFVVGRALEEVVHAVLLERPELFDHPALEAELTHLVVAYLHKP